MAQDVAAPRPVDPMAPCNQCRDFDEDCAGIADKAGRWLYGPEQGWCPWLVDGTPPASHA